MSSKKTKEISENYQKALDNTNEIAKILNEAHEEDLKFLESKREEVTTILDDNNIFCGVILDTATILEILKLHIETNEPVKIPFNLYFN